MAPYCKKCQGALVLRGPFYWHETPNGRCTVTTWLPEAFAPEAVERTPRRPLTPRWRPTADPSSSPPPTAPTPATDPSGTERRLA